MKLIPNDISVTQQFKILGEFLKLVEKWAGVEPYQLGPVYVDLDVDQLLKDSGVKCQIMGNRLTGFDIVDDKAYLLFLLKWS